jgi:hypothetical protein
MFEVLYKIRDTQFLVHIHQDVYVIFNTIYTFQIAFVFLYELRNEAIQIFTMRFVDGHFAFLGGKYDMEKKFYLTHGLERFWLFYIAKDSEFLE